MRIEKHEADLLVGTLGAGGAKALARARRDGSTRRTEIPWLTWRKRQRTFTLAPAPEGPAQPELRGGSVLTPAMRGRL